MFNSPISFSVYSYPSLFATTYYSQFKALTHLISQAFQFEFHFLFLISFFKMHVFHSSTSEAKEREGTRSQLFAESGLGLHNWA